MVASEPGHAGPGRNVSHEPVETRAPGSRGAGPGAWLARDICHLSGEGVGQGLNQDCLFYYLATCGTSSSTRCCGGWSRRCRTPRWGPAAARTARPGSASPCCCNWTTFVKYNYVAILSPFAIIHDPLVGLQVRQLFLIIEWWSDDHLGAAELVSLGAAAEHVRDLLCLRTVETLVPSAVRVHKPRAVRGAENN